MGFLKKVIRPFKKLASFTGKVVKGAASGGLVGAAAAFVKNVGPAKKKTKAQKSLDAKGIYKNSNPNNGSAGGGVRFNMDKFSTT